MRRVQPDVIRPFEQGHLRDGGAGLQLERLNYPRPARADEAANLPVVADAAGAESRAAARRSAAARTESHTGSATNGPQPFAEATRNTGAAICQSIRDSWLRAPGPSVRATPSAQKENELGAVRITRR